MSPKHVVQCRLCNADAGIGDVHNYETVMMKDQRTGSSISRVCEMNIAAFAYLMHQIFQHCRQTKLYSNTCHHASLNCIEMEF